MIELFLTKCNIYGLVETCRFFVLCFYLKVQSIVEGCILIMLFFAQDKDLTRWHLNPGSDKVFLMFIFNLFIQLVAAFDAAGRGEVLDLGSDFDVEEWVIDCSIILIEYGILGRPYWFIVMGPPTVGDWPFLGDLEVQFFQPVFSYFWEN